jgi:hypothetical protein
MMRKMPPTRIRGASRSQRSCAGAPVLPQGLLPRLLRGSIRRLRLALPFLLLLVGAMPSASAEPSAPETRLQSVLDTLRSQHGFPGATAACVLPDGSVEVAGIEAYAAIRKALDAVK